MIRSQAQSFGEFRELLASIDRRLANIEHHLGLAAGNPEEPGAADEPSA
jgi:hypothetical protein